MHHETAPDVAPTSSSRTATEVDRLDAALAAQAASLAHARKIFARASAAARIGVWECTLEGERLTWTDVVYDIFDIPRGSPLDRGTTLACYTPESRAALTELRDRAIRDVTGFELDAEIVTVKGNRRWIRLTATVECDDGVAVRIFGMKQDITEEKTLSDRTRYLAEFDPLTGLANRGRFQARLAALGEAGEARIGALLLVDLDGFKQVNDTFGHGAGDACLVEVASRLRDLCIGGDLVARIGGDEFALLLDAACVPEERAAQIVAALRRPIEGGEHAYQLGASVGIAHAGPCDAGPCDAACGPTDLLSRADTALYAAKHAGRNTFRTFTPAMNRTAEARQAAIATLTAALARNALVLHYQPRFALADGRPVGLEALAYLRLPDGRVVAAEGAEGPCEDPALVHRLGQWVVETALAQAASWKRAGLEVGPMVIGLRAVCLRRRSFAETLLLRIAALGLRPGMVAIEVPEAVLAEAVLGEGGRADLRAVLQRLRSGGVRVALGGFGTERCALLPLREGMVDTLVIAPALVRGGLDRPWDHAILDAVVGLGGRLGLEVVAAGIETRAQRDALVAMGCPVGQGSWLAPPLCEAQVAALFGRSAPRRDRVA